MAQDLQISPEKNNDSSAFEAGAKVQLKQVGTSGTEIYAGYFNEEYLQELRGRKGAKVFDEMRRSEPQIVMLLNAVMNPIKAGNWDFEAATEVENGELHKELIEFCAKEMIDFETHIHEALTFIIYGYSIFEIVHNVVYDHPKFGTFNGLKGLAFRSQKTIERWQVDQETGALQWVEQWVQGDLAKNTSSMPKMDASTLLVMSMQKEGDNYEGLSALRPMFGPWFRKNLYHKLAGIGVEKAAIGTIVGTVPAGKQSKEQEDAFKEMLSNFTAHESAFILKPAGWEVEVINNDFDPSKLKELIVMENTEMINSLVANFLALGTNGGGGAYALGSDLSDFFLTGIQTYADFICGVWNRVLIPNLIKLNFGPQSDYPKLKASNITDKAGKELAEILGMLIGANAIKADTKLEDFLRKTYSLPKAEPETAREKAPIAPASPAMFSENNIKLAEGYRSQWTKNKKKTKELMQENLKVMLDDLKKQIERQYKAATESQKILIGLKIAAKTAEYEKALREQLAEVANDALLAARKVTPKAARKVKLAEGIKLAAAPRGGFYEALPVNIQRIIKAQAALIATTQGADLNKVVAFQYSSSRASTPDIGQIIADIEAAAAPTIEGSIARGISVDAAAGNAVSTVFNQAQLEWFFEPEVLNTIESFTFFNEAAVSPICQELDGTTWAVGDPDLDRYAPPLHHNCKSRLVPNEKGADQNPEINRGGTSVSKKGLDSITLCEHECHLEVVQDEPKK